MQQGHINSRKKQHLQKLLPLRNILSQAGLTIFRTISPEKPARTEQDELIDKFIKDSPVISRGTDVPPAEKDISGADSLDSDSFMTETLARIYEKQGLLKKAIYAYEKLSLKYPEKSTYFATQINRIKSQLEKNL